MRERLGGAAVELVAVAPPEILSASLRGNQLVFAGTNGLAGRTYFVLTATNLALPIDRWPVVATNLFGGGGFRITNAVAAGSPAGFYLLETP